MALIRPLEDIYPQHDYLMGYDTGVERRWWLGIEGVTSIFMGAWSDPLIGYRGLAVNEPMMYDALCDRFSEEFSEECGVSDPAEDMDLFATFLCGRRSEVLDLIDEEFAYCLATPGLAEECLVSDRDREALMLL